MAVCKNEKMFNQERGSVGKVFHYYYDIHTLRSFDTHPTQDSERKGSSEYEVGLIP